MERKCAERAVIQNTLVGDGGCAFQVNPPLMVTEEILREGLGVLMGIVKEMYQ